MLGITHMYLPKAAQSWIEQRLKAIPNLHVYLRTTIVDASTNAAGNVTVTMMTRTYKVPADREWSGGLSDQILDWYSRKESSAFSKEIVTNVHPRLVIDASELGDVIGAARLPYTLGVEVPGEISATTPAQLNSELEN